jgi:TPR repeat protein
MAYDVFISYALEDKIVADAACAMLESHAVRCWIAPRDVLPGMAYGEAIIDAIRGCRIMILIFSSKSNKSPHIPKEIERAVSAGVAVIPFRIEDVKPGKSLDYFIGSVHWLDALTPPLEQHLERLVHNVQTLLSRDAPVIERKSSMASAPAAPASAFRASSAASVSAPAQGQSARTSWLYVALGGLAVLVMVFAVLYFARKPSTTARVAPAPVTSTQPVASQPPAAATSQSGGAPNAGSNAAAATAPKAAPAAAARRTPQKEPAIGAHDNARPSKQPESPASRASPSTPSTPIYEQALSLYKSGNLSGAADLNRKACDSGERQGCNNLGLMYYRGEGVPKDLSRAANLYQRACDAGGTGGCTNLGLMYLRGESVPKDPNRAAELFKRGCDTNAPVACTNLGLMYARGENLPQDMNRAATLYKRACDGGNAQGCNFLGLLYEHGRGVPKELNRAAELFKKACDAGLDLGCENRTRLKRQPAN